MLPELSGPSVTDKHFDGDSERLVCRPRPRIPSDQDCTMLTASQRHEPVVRRTPGDAIAREFPVRSLCCGRRQNQYFIEVLIDERDRVRRRNARVTRQPGED